VLSTVHTHANTDDHALSEISHPGAVQTLHAPASRYPCMCFSSNRAPVVCEKGTWNPTRKAHSLTQRRSASTSAGVWDFMARIARAPRPTQLKPRLYTTTPPYLMSLCPASSLTQTHGTTPRLGTTRASSPRGCPTRLKLNEQNPVHGPRRAPTWAGALAILARIILRTPPTTQPTHGRCRRNRPAQSDRGWNVGEWHTQVDATCITAATMPRPTDRRLAVPCSGGALDDRVVAPPTAPTGASLPPEHRSHQSIAPTGAPLPLEHRSHRSHGHGSRHGAPRRPTIYLWRPLRSTRRTSGVYRSCPPPTHSASGLACGWHGPSTNPHGTATPKSP
jgi:hypothetical protein